MPREVDVGLSEEPLDSEEALALLEMFEERLVRVLRKKLGRRLQDLDLVIEAELDEGGRRLSLRVDLRAAGRLIAPVSYDEVVAEAIDEAARWLQEQLLRRRGAKGGSEEAARAVEAGGNPGSDNGPS
jgi:hypothetical protein